MIVAVTHHVHTTLLESHAWNGRTNDRGIAIIKFCEGWPKGGSPTYVLPDIGHKVMEASEG